MQGIFLRWAVNVAALFLTSNLVKGIHINDLVAGLVAATLLGVVNAVLRPIISFFTWPLNFLTLGIFPFILNGAMLMLVGNLVKGFAIEGFIPAILGAVVLGFISYLLNLFVR